MRVLLQHCHRLTYYKAPQDWTSDPEEAMSFSDPVTALKYFREREMEDIQIVLRFNPIRTFKPRQDAAPQLHLRQDMEAWEPELRP